MAVIGKVESLWRYPVKSMRGEELHEAFVGFEEETLGEGEIHGGRRTGGKGCFHFSWGAGIRGRLGKAEQ